MAFTVVKAPSAIQDFSISWANELTQNYGGDTLATSNWSVDITGLTIISNSLSTTNGTTTVKISGGTDLITYLLTNTVTTASGRTLTDTITVICQI